METIYRETVADGNRYDIYVGKWGFLPAIIEDTILAEGSAVDLTVVLHRGYEDDFTTDLGWATSGTATGGRWERGVPTETRLNNTIVQLGRDADGDFGGRAYVTGASGSSAEDNDVDDGTVVLTSPPINLRAEEEARVSFAYYFAVRGGSVAADDTLLVELLTEDGRAVELLRVGDNAPDYRRFRSRSVRTLLGVGTEAIDGLRVRVSTQDLASAGHFVEAIIDDFAVGERDGPPLQISPEVICAPATVSYTLAEALPGAVVEADGATDVQFDGRVLTATYAEAGAYDLRLTASVNGETVTYRYPEALTVRDVPTADFSFGVGDDNLVAFESEAAGATELSWDFGDGGSSVVARPIHQFPAAGDYEVTLTATSPCGVRNATQTVTAVLVGVEELARETGLRVVANPVRDVLTVDYSAGEPVDLEVTDLMGRVVLSQKLYAAGRHTIDVSGLVAGIYFVGVPARGASAATLMVQR